MVRGRKQDIESDSAEDSVGIGKALRIYREERGMTQDEMAVILTKLFEQKTSLARAVVAQVESERMLLGDEKVARLESLLKVKPGKFILRRFAMELKRKGIAIPELRIETTPDEQKLLDMWSRKEYGSIIDFTLEAAKRESKQAKRKRK